jgi:hypothetical protein
MSNIVSAFQLFQPITGQPRLVFPSWLFFGRSYMLGNTDIIVSRAALNPLRHCFMSVLFHDVWTLKQKRNKPMPVVHRGGFRFRFISVSVSHLWALLASRLLISTLLQQSALYTDEAFDDGSP